MANKEKPIFDKFAYDKEYTKKNVVRFSVLLNRKYDSDMIDHIQKQKSKSEYFKKLIRQDMDQ